MEKINLIDFQKRKLEEFYVVAYVVSKCIRIRTESCIVDKELYVIFAFNIIGNREILGMFFSDEENNRFWLERFEDFQARGLKQMLFFVTPNNKNIERCVKIIYNDVKIIHSPEDTVEHVSKFLAFNKSRKIKIALKDLFLASDIDRYRIDLKQFKEFYIDNNILLVILDRKQDEIEKYYSYPQNLRKLFYPYYAIRDMKKTLNKLKRKDPLCNNINDVIEYCLPYINSFEIGRTYNKKEWLKLIEFLYEEHKDKMEEYIWEKKN